MEERPEERGADQPAAEGPGESPEAAQDTSAAWEGGSGWINTEVAAAALDVSPRTVRDYIAAGKLVARTEGSGVQRRHMVDIGSLQALLDDRRRESPRSRREDRASVEAAIVAAGSADASAAETIRDLVTRLEARSAEAADARARLELTERAQSTLRGELEREREERRRIQEEAGGLRDELEAERSRGFWRRLFGG